VSADNSEALDGWELLPAADPGRAEAQAAADAALTEDGLVPGISSNDDYVYRYVLETGGKPERESDSVVDRVTNMITNSLRPTHPPHHMVVQVQPAIPQEAEPGQPPPTPEPDPDAQVLSLVMVRDLGQTRLPAALLTLGSALVFGLLCAMLHQRDKPVAANRAAPLPVGVSTNGGCPHGPVPSRRHDDRAGRGVRCDQPCDVEVAGAPPLDRGQAGPVRVGHRSHPARGWALPGALLPGGDDLHRLRHRDHLPVP